MIAHLASNTVLEQKKLDKACGDKDPLAFIRKKTHEYFGMMFVFGLRMGAATSQYGFIKKIYNELPEHLKGRCEKPPLLEDFFR